MNEPADGSPRRRALAVLALGLMAVGQLNARLVRRVEPRRVLRVALIVQALAGLTLLAVVELDPPGGAGPGLAAVLPTLFVVVASLGCVLPNTTALALARHPGTAGSASALLGTLQFLIGAAAAPFTGGSDARPLGIVVAAMASAALVAMLTLTRGAARYEALPEPVAV